MYELFSVAWGQPDVREQWQQATPQARAQLLQQANSRTYQPDPMRAHVPASEYGAEWYGSAEDICRVHVALQAGAVGKAAPVKQILAAAPGINLDRARWPYIGAKAGGLPGDLTFSWYAVDRTGQPWVVSFQLNWPRDHGPSVDQLDAAGRQAGLRADTRHANRPTTSARRGHPTPRIPSSNPPGDPKVGQADRPRNRTGRTPR